MIVSVLLGVFVGAVLGLTGAGGGILAVPALVFGMGWPMQQAAPVALFAVAGAAAVGAAEGFRGGLVRYRAALTMAAAGVPFTAAGAYLAHGLPQALLLVLFALVMLIVARRLLSTARAGHGDDHHHGALYATTDPDTGRIQWTPQVSLLIGGIGAATGLLTGLLGVGGGFMIVPMLKRFTALTMHGIVATSLAVIALVSSGGVVTALLHGAHMPLVPTATFVGANVAGMIIGRLLARRLDARHVQMGFGGLLVVVAIGLLVKAATHA